MKTKHTRVSLAFTLGTLLFATAASADGWPPSVVGSWSVLGNQSLGTLSITSQAPSGQCRKILGTIYGNPIEGFYCPFSGRIHFVRKDNVTNDTSQAWTGNLSQAIAGQPLRMGGVFSSVGPGGGSLGEYNFHATK
jgi:hypothetical protein